MSLFKFVLRPVTLLATLTTVLACSRPSHADWTVTEAMKQTASFEVKNASTDDYYLAVAQAYHLNLFLDSTRVPQDAPRITDKFENATMWAKVHFFASRHNINGEPLDGGKTVLLWQQPDLQPIARALVAKGEIKAVPADTPGLGRLMMHNSALAPQLVRFFRDKKAWDGTGPFHATASFEELPEELRARLALQTRGIVWNLGFTPVAPQWFRDDFWKSVQLRNVTGRDAVTGAARPEVAVAGIIARNPDGTPIEEVVFVSEPGMPFRIDHITPPKFRTPQTPAGPTNDSMLAQSSLAAPYQPLPDPDLALTTDTALNQKVTLQAKRQPLGAVVKILGEKGGVALSVAPQLSANQALLTVGLNDMPLRDAMLALTRLLGLEWSKAAGGAYSAERERGTALDVQLLQAHQLSPIVQLRELPAVKARQAQEAQEWAAKIVGVVGQAPLAMPEGVPFSDLPDDIQAGLRARIQAGLAPILVDTQARLRESADELNQAWHLELDVPAQAVRHVTTAKGQQFDVAQYTSVHVVSQSGHKLASITLQSEAPTFQ